ncbi:MAG: hypothetical protein WCB10_00920 [Steroidobacteraceae bacterium]
MIERNLRPLRFSATAVTESGWAALPTSHGRDVPTTNIRRSSIKDSPLDYLHKSTAWLQVSYEEFVQDMSERLVLASWFALGIGLQVLVLIGVGGALLVIYFFHWLPSALAINILIVLPCLLALGRGSSTAADTLSQVANARLPGQGGSQ